MIGRRVGLFRNLRTNRPQSVPARASQTPGRPSPRGPRRTRQRSLRAGRPPRPAEGCPWRCCPSRRGLPIPCRTRPRTPPSETRPCQAPVNPLVSCPRNRDLCGTSRRWRQSDDFCADRDLPTPSRRRPRSRSPYRPRHQEPSSRLVDCLSRRGPRGLTRRRSAPRPYRLLHRAPVSRLGGCRASPGLCRNQTFTAVTPSSATRRETLPLVPVGRSESFALRRLLGRCESALRPDDVAPRVLAGVRVGVCALEAFPRGLRGRRRDPSFDVDKVRMRVLPLMLVAVCCREGLPGSLFLRGRDAGLDIH